MGLIWLAGITVVCLTVAFVALAITGRIDADTATTAVAAGTTGLGGTALGRLSATPPPPNHNEGDKP